MRIAVCGPRGVGKTTLAEYLVEQFGWYHIRYNDVLKQWLCDAINAARSKMELPPITVAHMLQHKEKYRHLQQLFGDEVGFNVGNGVMDALLEWQSQRWPGSQDTIFDNVRFQAQYDILKPYGFVLVELRSEYRRARSEGLADGHHAEHQPLRPDIILDADKPVEDIADVLLRLSGQVRTVNYEAA